MNIRFETQIWKPGLDLKMKNLEMRSWIPGLNLEKNRLKPGNGYFLVYFNKSYDVYEQLLISDHLYITSTKDWEGGFKVI